MEKDLAIFICGIILIYLWIFLFVFFDKAKEYLILNRFYRAIKSIISSQTITIEEFYDQSMLNYNKLYQNSWSRKQTSYIDLLENIISRCDSYTNADFKSVFRDGKNEDVRAACLKLRTYVIQKKQFPKLPDKDAAFLSNIKVAMSLGNVEMGDIMLQQLSEEIAGKENRLRKQEKNNKITTLLSILGLVLTLFFGIVSMIQMEWV